MIKSPPPRHPILVNVVQGLPSPKTASLSLPTANTTDARPDKAEESRPRTTWSSLTLRSSGQVCSRDSESARARYSRATKNPFSESVQLSLAPDSLCRSIRSHTAANPDGERTRTIERSNAEGGRRLPSDARRRPRPEKDAKLPHFIEKKASGPNIF
jgi:hypothetical protein